MKEGHKDDDENATPSGITLDSGDILRSCREKYVGTIDKNIV